MRDRRVWGRGALAETEANPDQLKNILLLELNCFRHLLIHTILALKWSFK
jgi:hypothetical protein